MSPSDLIRYSRTFIAITLDSYFRQSLIGQKFSKNNDKIKHIILYLFILQKLNTAVYKEETKTRHVCLGPVKISNLKGSVFDNTASPSQGKGLFSLWLLAFATHVKLEGLLREEKNLILELWYKAPSWNRAECFCILNSGFS